MSHAITEASIAAHFAVLSKIGNLGPKLEDGFTRLAWSDEESKAFAYIEEQAQQLGFESHVDAVGNLYLSYACSPGREVVQIGSHLDTVIRGGLFDGAAGIVCGLECFRNLIGEGKEFKRGLQLIIWRGEESGPYRVALKGSKAAFGLLPAQSLDEVYNAQPLEKAIEKQGFSPEPIRSATALIPQESIDTIAAHFELHIEQARKLEIDGDDIGVVTSIRGVTRFRLEFFGEAAHSGATPMGTEYRKDANLAMAYFQVAFDTLGKEKGEQHDLVQTIGVINSDAAYNESHREIYENGISRVCPYAYCTLDIRSNEAALLKGYPKEIAALLEEICTRFKVSYRLQHLSDSTPVESLNPDLQGLLEESAQALGFRSQRLPSGAGHDVQTLAMQRKSDGSFVPALLVFIPCRDGISHNPLEYCSDEAMVKGAQTLANAISKLVF